MGEINRQNHASVHFLAEIDEVSAEPPLRARPRYRLESRDVRMKMPPCAGEGPRWESHAIIVGGVPTIHSSLIHASYPGTHSLHVALCTPLPSH